MNRSGRPTKKRNQKRLPPASPSSHEEGPLGGAEPNGCTRRARRQKHTCKQTVQETPFLKSVGPRAGRSHSNRNNERNNFHRTSFRPGPKTKSTNGWQADFAHGRDESLYQTASDRCLHSTISNSKRSTEVRRNDYPAYSANLCSACSFYKQNGGVIFDPVLK